MTSTSRPALPRALRTAGALALKIVALVGIALKFFDAFGGPRVRPERPTLPPDEISTLSVAR